MLRRCSTAAAFSGSVVLLHLAGMARFNRDIRLLDIVFGLLLLVALVIFLVCDCLLRASALLLTVGIAWACRLLRALFFANICLLGGNSCGSILVVLSTLGPSVRGTLGTCGMSLTIIIVIGLFLFSGCAVCTLGDAWARSLLCTVFSVSFINFFSSSAPSLLFMCLIALLQPAMAAICGFNVAYMGAIVFW